MPFSTFLPTANEMLNRLIKSGLFSILIGVQSCVALSGYRFGQLIDENYQLVVWKWEGEAQEHFKEAARATCEVFNDSQDVVFDRMNEVGIAVEKLLRNEFRQLGLECGVPETRSGRKQSAGYPDLMLQIDGVCFYLEVKVFSTGTVDSSQRTFYFTVSDNPKVIHDAYHLLIGFEIEKTNDSNYRVLSYHIRDLRDLPCKVKIEYNASNRVLYGDRDQDDSYRIIETISKE